MSGQCISRRSIAVLAFAGTLALLVAGCGGGGGGGAAGGGTPVVSSGTMTKGSVILNGVRFEDTLAHITADDTRRPPHSSTTGCRLRS
jgi:hypothetical protein